MKRLLALVLIVIPSFAVGAAAPVDDVAAVFTNLSKMLDISADIEKLAEKQQLPEANGAAAAARVIGYRLADLTDPWGTPYDIQLGPGAHYSIISAGSDRRFEPRSWNDKGEVQGSAADVVLRDDVLVRANGQWAESQLADLHVDVANALQRELTARKVARTKVRMGAVATVLGTYAIDHQKLYPPPEAIERSVVPDYIGVLPNSDAWDHPLHVTVAPDRKTFRIVSAGADGKFDSSVPATPSVSKDPKADLILTEKGWLQDCEPPLSPIEHAYGRFFASRSAAFSRSLDRRDAAPGPAAQATPPPPAVSTSGPVSPLTVQLTPQQQRRLEAEHVYKTDPIAAIKIYAAETRADPSFDSPLALVQYVRFLIKQWNWNKRDAERNGVSFYGMGEKFGGGDLAIDLMNRSLQKTPDNSPLALELAEMYALRMRTNEALSTLAMHPRAFSSDVNRKMWELLVLAESDRKAESVAKASSIPFATVDDTWMLEKLADAFTQGAVHTHGAPYSETYSNFVQTAITIHKRLVAITNLPEHYFKLSAILGIAATWENDPAKQKQLREESDKALAEATSRS